MNLEDHVGDVIRKARGMAEVPVSAAAAAAGLTERELAELEETGRTSGKPDYTRLARALGLVPAKLEKAAAGWLPTPIDLGRWRKLRCFITTGGGLSVNAYLVWDEVSREAALFDTGWDASPALRIITQDRLLLRHLLITHSHEDHIAGVEKVRAAFPDVRLHSGSRVAHGGRHNPLPDFIQLGSLRITNRDTPGHAEDGKTYIVDAWPGGAPQVAIVGDAIFAGSMGRGNQSWDLARQRVREHILSLPPDTLLCPGHGPPTTVAEERAFNPFF